MGVWGYRGMGYGLVFKEVSRLVWKGGMEGRKGGREGRKGRDGYGYAFWGEGEGEGGNKVVVYRYRYRFFGLT